jgi:hypothetical protein
MMPAARLVGTPGKKSRLECRCNGFSMLVIGCKNEAPVELNRVALEFL